ncbi:MAG: glycosyltransferase, partial [Actinobacteria bacterium]|nr:glycosyltransferase [Actinomycetota bacterium]
AQRATNRSETRDARKSLNSAVANRKRPRDPQNLHWAIKTSVPAGPSGQGWGDLYFANEIAASLTKLGHTVRVDFRNDVIHPDSANDDVVLVLRGVEQIRPQAGAINLLWIISHPSRISRHEVKAFDAVFAASNSWAKKASKRFGLVVNSLLQATNPDKFTPTVAEPDSGEVILFLGNTGNKFRQIIRDCVDAGISPAIYGKDWDLFVSKELIKGSFVPNETVAGMYRSAGVVLNDHWPDMAKHGFLSNRLFDAAASGARVVSDDVAGIRDVFGESVAVYRTPSELAELCSKANREKWGSQDEIAERANQIGFEHSFDQRAKA